MPYWPYIEFSYFAFLLLWSVLRIISSEISSNSKIFFHLCLLCSVLISKLFTWPFFMGPYSLLMFSNILYFSVNIISYALSSSCSIWKLAVFHCFCRLSSRYLVSLCVLWFLTVSYYFPWNFYLWEVFEDWVTERRLFASASLKEGTANSKLL